MFPAAVLSLSPFTTFVSSWPMRAVTVDFVDCGRLGEQRVGRSTRCAEGARGFKYLDNGPSCVRLTGSDVLSEVDVNATGEDRVEATGILRGHVLLLRCGFTGHVDRGVKTTGISFKRNTASPKRVVSLMVETPCV